MAWSQPQVGSQRRTPVRPDRIAPLPDEPPPPRGLPLGLTLGLVLALAVSVVLGVITGVDLHRELAMERAMREARLAERLAELGGELSSVRQRDDLARTVAQLRERAEATSGLEHGFELRGTSGPPVVVAATDDVFRPPAGAVVATVDVACPVLAGGVGRLTAWRSGRDLAADRARLWRDWTMDLVLTSLAIIVAVELAVHILIGRPLRRLVGGLRRLERGHVGPIDPGAGAWEIRWLAWRFERLGRELADNARRLVAAERRALDTARLLSGAQPPDPDAGPTGGAQPPVIGDDRPNQATLARQYLEDTYRLLATLDARDPTAHGIAVDAWANAVVEAERIGDNGLKAQLEDAALSILEVREFAELDTELTLLRERRLSWSRSVGQRLTRELDEAGVPVVEIQHRIKHTAGVWRKMREAEIRLDEVHDLFAFRIIVPAEPDCYVALAAVHRCFEPEPFRFKDYIESPKPNGYRSLHTTVRDADGRLFEVQIRTQAMHQAAEAGDAAHWRYRANRWGSVASLRPRSRWSRPWRRLFRRPSR